MALRSDVCAFWLHSRLHLLDDSLHARRGCRWLGSIDCGQRLQPEVLFPVQVRPGIHGWKLLLRQIWADKMIWLVVFLMMMLAVLRSVDEAGLDGPRRDFVSP